MLCPKRGLNLWRACKIPANWASPERRRPVSDNALLVRASVAQLRSNRSTLGTGTAMDDLRTKRRDEIQAFLLISAGLVIVLSFAVWHWSQSVVREDRFGNLDSPLRCDLNQLTADELQMLPGVGLATATRIVDRRSQIGGFKSIEQLSEVPGIGPGRISRLRPYLFVSGEMDSSDRKDVPSNERPIPVASSVSTSRGPTQSH
jgi:competence ComEA-like helix-hairpin-helix protein